LTSVDASSGEALISTAEHMRLGSERSEALRIKGTLMQSI